jgi:hypothetical protein
MESARSAALRTRAGVVDLPVHHPSLSSPCGRVRVPLCRLSGGPGTAAHGYDHDETGWFAQSLRLKSELHLVKGSNAVRLRCNLPAVVASNGVARESAVPTRLRPSRSAGCGGLCGELAKRAGNRAGKFRPDRPAPGGFADQVTTPALRRDTCRTCFSSHRRSPVEEPVQGELQIAPCRASPVS